MCMFVSFCVYVEYLYAYVNRLVWLSGQQAGTRLLEDCLVLRRFVYVNRTPRVPVLSSCIMECAHYRYNDSIMFY